MLDALRSMSPKTMMILIGIIIAIIFLNAKVPTLIPDLVDGVGGFMHDVTAIPDKIDLPIGDNK